MIKLGVIGYGTRISAMIDLMIKISPQVKIAAIADPRCEEIKNMSIKNGVDPKEISFFDNADDMLKHADIDAVCVGTRCSLHAKMGAEVLATGLPLFLEKPIATTIEDLITLRNAYKTSKSKVVVSFPLKVSPITTAAKEIIDSGKLGNIYHAQAWNYVSYGQVYFQNWYRDEQETGGLFLQKATHDFDYINYLIGYEPQTICAMVAKQIYKGNKPAAVYCNVCDENKVCIESPFNRKAGGHGLPESEWNKLQCAFATDTGNEDSGSAIVRYDTGMHMNYTQNFFVKKKAMRRGVSLSGYDATLEFDFYTNQIKVFNHHKNIVETYDVTIDTGHCGGDEILCENFVEMIEGKADSLSPLDAGLTSVLMCLKAKESAATDEFKSLNWEKI